MQQLELFASDLAVADLRVAAVSLHDYDVVIINSSAGKDSQAMLTYLVELADAQGYPRERLIVVHADLGRVEWRGTRELAEAQAAFYGLRFEAVQRDEDLLDQIVTRRRTLDAEADALELDAYNLDVAGWHKLAMLVESYARQKRGTPAWPSSQARYCTSDQKTSQVAKLMTRLATEWRKAGNTGPIRILNTLGIRAQESPKRAEKNPLERDSASNTRREVTRWLPIFEWSEAEVWATIRRSGVPYHEAYDAGMPRLSCVFCVLAGHRELVLAARLNPELADAYVAVEVEVGHTFKKGMSIASIVDEARTP
jgi:3'-phosphoadenosine 5'-phosphosulfate sulfotransferase (PAPS reductase)/FAD synthetase